MQDAEPTAVVYIIDSMLTADKMKLEAPGSEDAASDEQDLAAADTATGASDSEDDAESSEEDADADVDAPSSEDDSSVKTAESSTATVAADMAAIQTAANSSGSTRAASTAAASAKPDHLVHMPDPGANATETSTTTPTINIPTTSASSSSSVRPGVNITAVTPSEETYLFGLTKMQMIWVSCGAGVIALLLIMAVSRSCRKPSNRRQPPTDVMGSWDPNAGRAKSRGRQVMARLASWHEVDLQNSPQVRDQGHMKQPIRGDDSVMSHLNDDWDCDNPPHKGRV
jgi:hypothetical protein